ncbi:complement C1q-like protein 2 [Stegastes partitus]|uniref:Complement C1q-like protein 2 n=1 Tax=Stegastes partitus TaxID=144197 RepID=A0A9Y4JW08_9TELE|nr:PREDICTED: complement C1q-like protein 2 [Stegastes partitus]
MILSIYLLMFFCCGLTVAGYKPPCPESCASQAELHKVKHKVEDLERKLKENVDLTAELKRIVTFKVAFSAAIGRYGSIGPYTTDKILLYKRVITNVGNSYNKHKGIFTAPVAGIYYFSFFYHAGGDCEAMLYLYKNYKLVVMTSDHISKKDTADNGGNGVVLHLQKGDQVYVCMAAYTHIWGSFYHSTFSGFLISRH